MPYKERSKRIVGRMHTVDLTQHESVEVLFMGDIHAGDSAHDMERFLEDVAYLKETPNAYAFFNGDLYQAEGKHTVGVANGVWPVKEIRHYLSRTLGPIREKILGVNRGNHDARIYKHGCGEDSVDALCAELGLYYFDSGEADLLIRVGKCPSNGQPVCYGIFAAHGSRGGRTEGARANAVADFRKVRPGADAYVMSHVHAPLVVSKREHAQDITRGNIVERQVMLVVTPSYQKRDGYAIDHNFEPQARGAAHVTFDGRFKRMTAVCE